MLQKRKQDLGLSWTFTQDVTYLYVGGLLCSSYYQICFERFDYKSYSYSVNLVPSASFRYKKKAEKRLWNTSNTWLKFAQIEGIFFRINYRIYGRQYWKHQCFYSYKFGYLVCRAKDKNKIKTRAENNVSISL